MLYLCLNLETEVGEGREHKDYQYQAWKLELWFWSYQYFKDIKEILSINYANKFDKMGKLLERYKWSKLTQEEIEYHNTHLTLNIQFLIKSFLTKKTTGPVTLLVNSIKHLGKKEHQASKISFIIEIREYFPNNFLRHHYPDIKTGQGHDKRKDRLHKHYTKN